ncbi:50S ribosomal protein L9 [Campylobacter corcagiensis]|uniref:Large ribosomal subunit protein bL9 n=1 Tax=Campylobacter corcagiensis TaxID=1448857 RepID=A0A7M1LF68_9BACT|nr:50S ribosomal protein L9 [Campylobacter corcagiensis]QKF64600.1 50S ribosomal protein L9 [Campylobacter corcagiensis]QOQ87227.1 50S ribosomal protein L9 [Campylobacter corcagiensis]
MRVLLIKDVKGLGKAGEIKDVKDGYGHNFLVGKGFAKVATDAVIRQHNAQLKKEAAQLEAQKEEFRDLAKKLEKIRPVIKKPVGENGTLFGSVTKDDVANALKEQNGIELDKKILELDSIKNVGIFDVEAKFKHQISAKFEIEVVAE